MCTVPVAVGTVPVNLNFYYPPCVKQSFETFVIRYRTVFLG